MELKFNGIGSCFNPEFGNTSACLPLGDMAFLFDCGESAFGGIVKNSLLSGFKKINIFITHSHSDHCGSLSSLLFYCYYVLKVKPTVFAPASVFQILDLQGTFKEAYNEDVLIRGKKYNFLTSLAGPNGLTSVCVYPHQVKHAKNLECFGFFVTDSLGDSFYYSGDSKEIGEPLLTLFKKKQIRKIYQDCSWVEYPDSLHMSYKRMCEIFPDREDRRRITLMHLETGTDFDKMVKDGWNLPQF